jgi:CO/xanthine dehydrogenase Mo-binding subunit
VVAQVADVDLSSGTVYGLSAALSGEITIKGGTVQPRHFHDHPPLMINDTPDMLVENLNSGKAMGMAANLASPVRIQGSSLACGSFFSVPPH